MELKIREARKRKSEERLRELLDEDVQIAESDGLMDEDEYLEVKMKIGSYQCPICGLCSGYGWSGEPDDPPSCCGGVSMVAYEIPNNIIIHAQ